MSAKIKITEDPYSEMLSITADGKTLFHGNYWDFNRDGESFKSLFERAGLEVELEEKDYNEWN